MKAVSFLQQHNGFFLLETCAREGNSLKKRRLTELPQANFSTSRILRQCRGPRCVFYTTHSRSKKPLFFFHQVSSNYHYVITISFILRKQISPSPYTHTAIRFTSLVLFNTTLHSTLYTLHSTLYTLYLVVNAIHAVGETTAVVWRFVALWTII